MKEKENKNIIDKNYFKATSYEFAGEIGVLDNEEMKNNKKLISNKNKEKHKKNKK
jgi:hypothetical protein